MERNMLVSERNTHCESYPVRLIRE